MSPLSVLCGEWEMVKMGLALDFYPHFPASLGARCPFKTDGKPHIKQNLENRCPISRFICIDMVITLLFAQSNPLECH